MSRVAIQFVEQYTPLLRGPRRERYVARAYMARQPGGLWEAWLVFFALRTGVALATDRETTQSTREHVLYWASGLRRTYLQGALQRALDRRPEVELMRRADRVERREALALAEARVYARAAVDALREAQVAESEARPLRRRRFPLRQRTARGLASTRRRRRTRPDAHRRRARA